jgi:hypothetical protein
VKDLSAIFVLSILCTLLGGRSALAQSASSIQGKVAEGNANADDMRALINPPAPSFVLDTPASVVTPTDKSDSRSHLFTYCELSGGAWCALKPGPAHMDCWCSDEHGNTFTGKTKNETTARQ